MIHSKHNTGILYFRNNMDITSMEMLSTHFSLDDYRNHS